MGNGLLPGESIPLNLGEVLRGDRIIASDIDLEMSQEKECAVLCNKNMTSQELRRSRKIIEDGYVVEWIVDNLPGATSFVTVDETRKYYASGFKLGYTETDAEGNNPRYYVNNHFTIVIRHRRAAGRAGERGESIIVGFEIYPKSVGMKNKRDENGCPVDLQTIDGGFELAMPPDPIGDYFDEDAGLGDKTDPVNIPFTYSIHFREDSTIEWAHRWDLYFTKQEDGSHIHWLAIVNSLIICALLTGVVLIILAKTVRSDIQSFRDSAVEGGKLRTMRKPQPGTKSSGLLGQEVPDADEDFLDDDDEALEDVTGWKLLHADVFRTPRYGFILAPLIGSGMQLLFMSIGLVSLSAVGFLNPSFRGGFISVGVGLFIFAGIFSGYLSARVHKSFDGENHRLNALITASLFPGMLFGLIFILNLFVWAQASSTAMPFSTILAMLMLWLCVQVPLVYAGSYYGYHKAPKWEHPTKTTSIPRQVPQQSWYVQSIQSVLLAGLIPFAVIFIELLFIFQSVWQDKSGYYYLFGFLAVVLAILGVTVAEVTVVAVYIQLGSENHHWWWHSFFIGGGSSVWVFLYSVWYYFFKLHVSGFVSGMLFFAYSGLACLVYGLAMGTIGFLTAYAFVRRIYRYATLHLLVGLFTS